MSCSIREDLLSLVFDNSKEIWMEMLSPKINLCFPRNFRAKNLSIFISLTSSLTREFACGFKSPLVSADRVISVK